MVLIYLWNSHIYRPYIYQENKENGWVSGEQWQAISGFLLRDMMNLETKIIYIGVLDLGSA